MGIKKTSSNSGDEHLVVKKYLEHLTLPTDRQAVVVETGAGKSTKVLSDFARANNVLFYSCDCCEELVKFLDKHFNKDSCFTFVVRDSTEALAHIARTHPILDFVFLDASPSAMKTFNEFKLIENNLQPGSILVVDNAKLPDHKSKSKPARKGLILVPYLLASQYWEVISHPAAGGQMIAAKRHAEPDYADPRYEHPTYDHTSNVANRIATVKQTFNLT